VGRPGVPVAELAGNRGTRAGFGGDDYSGEERGRGAYKLIFVKSIFLAGFEGHKVLGLCVHSPPSLLSRL